MNIRPSKIGVSDKHEHKKQQGDHFNMRGTRGGPVLQANQQLQEHVSNI